MRLVKLGIYPLKYLHEFYAKNVQLEKQSYTVQHAALIADCFGSSDFWTREFRKLNYETIDIIANAELMQKRWATENDLSFDNTDWLFEIAAAQIRKFRPDVLLVADYSTFTAEFLRSLRRQNPSLRLILGWCGAPYNDSSVFDEWDIALSCIPEMVNDFNSKGHKSFHINHAFAPQILDKIDLNSLPSVDFSFVGSIIRQNRFHLERERILRKLVENTDLQIWSEIKLPSESSRRILKTFPFLKKVVPQKSAMNADTNDYIDASIARRAQPPLFGIEMFQKLRDSRVVLNTHIDISPLSASNMRLFEATGVGACLLTDWKQNVRDLFEPDREILTYRSPDECVEKVKYILENEPERRAVAAAGQRRTLTNHTFEKRVSLIDEIIKKHLSARTAKARI